MKRVSPFLLFVTLLLLASCGKQHQVQRLVEEFMNENMEHPQAVRSLHCHELDSTRLISDSLVMAFRQSLPLDGRYHDVVHYAEGTFPKVLVFTRVSYKIDETDYQDTYYIDRELTRVVAVKLNHAR